MKTLSLFLLLLSLPLLAQMPHVTILDPNIDSEELKKNFHVNRGSTHESSLPDKQVRDNLLAESKATSKWDELKKDIFFMDLKRKALPELKKKYPEFSITEIENLQRKTLK